MNYVIIGTGAAGIMAAKEIRKLKKDAQIPMISADEQVHSRCMLHKYLSHERTAEELSFVEEDFFEKNQIAEVYGHIEVIDTANQMVDTKGGESICYDKLLISTGADSFIPPVGDLRKAKNVFGLRHLKDAQEIDKMAEDAEKILIIGSGLVGLDAAYGLIERGKKVTVVEMAEQILPVQLDAHAAKTYQELFEQAGVQFYLGCKAEGAVCEADGMIRAVTLDTGKQLLCDLIIVAAGVRPAVGFLEKSEIEVERGIKVNSKMETNVPNVYAAGDVTTLSSIATPISANEQSYIGLFSQYVDEYQNIKCYTKTGLDENSYLVSVSMEIKFTGVDTTAPGLDFFYVRTNDDGSLYIDNLYSQYNLANQENALQHTESDRSV